MSPCSEGPIEISENCCAGVGCQSITHRSARLLDTLASLGVAQRLRLVKRTTRELAVRSLR